MTGDEVREMHQFFYLNDDVEEAAETLPSVGSAKLVIKDTMEPLFISATWTIIATVNGQVIDRSTSSDKEHTQLFIARWSKHLIRMKQAMLKRLGVDVEAEYVKLGGDLDDLRKY